MVQLSAALIAFALSGPSTALAASLPNDAILFPEATSVADSLPPLDSVVRARVSLDFGDGVVLVFLTRGIEVGVSTAPNPYLRNQLVATTRLRFTRRPDSLTAEFSRRVSTNERIPRVDVEIPAGPNDRTVRVHLADVQVASSRLTSSGDDGALRQQELLLVETVAQVSADADEAQRQLTVTASLEKRHLASVIELARARGNAALLASRLTVQQQRLALVERQLADYMPFEEEVVLAAVHAEPVARPPAP